MTTPAATLDKNPLAAALNVGRIHPDNLAPLAWHLDELVASNIASTKLMADRHADTPLAGFHALSYQSEKEAYDNLQPFVQACGAPPSDGCRLDALALAYPAQIARIAVVGAPWDFPVSFLHLCRASTASYRQLHRALSSTGRFTNDQLEHFSYFGHVDGDEIIALEAQLTDISIDARTWALRLAGHLATFEDLFWTRMVALCTPTTAS
ncbi:hypothetical protein K8W59_18870 [Nocardioides rotundus]|uniref:hypothetical protein n=1 Tax=Nocardioides rotundus TaxID=1774216 RepID=UPI001CC10FB8|nr:hypothetical protein [Nocardioides rotundus]UAL29768.1 hypothetical protein K8W59_18870 [Nocardioides rotundus]